MTRIPIATCALTLTALGAIARLLPHTSEFRTGRLMSFFAGAAVAVWQA